MTDGISAANRRYPEDELAFEIMGPAIHCLVLAFPDRRFHEEGHGPAIREAFGLTHREYDAFMHELRISLFTEWDLGGTHFLVASGGTAARILEREGYTQQELRPVVAKLRQLLASDSGA